MKKINDLKDLEIARLEAKLKASEALLLAKEAGSEIREDFNSFAAVGRTVGKFIRPSAKVNNQKGSSISGNKLSRDGIPWDELGLDVFWQLRKSGVKWQSVIVPIGIWLMKNGYFDQIVSSKKSDIYAVLLGIVKKARGNKNIKRRKNAE